MSKSDLVKSAIRIAYGISEKEGESHTEERKIYLTKENYKYLYDCCFPAGKVAKWWPGYRETIEDFVNECVIPDIKEMAFALNTDLGIRENAQMYYGITPDDEKLYENITITSAKN